jgi:hypothetical protein
LTEHLATEHAPPTQIAALAAKDPLLYAFERKKLDQVGEDRTHGAATSSRDD